eukprot:11192811-Lingulodinium_polyedra.AAC.1
MVARAKHAAGGQWTARMSEEENFNKAKKRRKFLEAINQNHVLTHKADPYDIDEARKLGAHDWKTQDATSARHCRAAARVPGAQASSGPVLVYMKGSMPTKMMGARLVCDASAANTFVFANPLKASRVAKWHAALRGGRIATPLWLKSQGKRGTSIAYEAAVAVRRQVWISPGIEKSCPALVQVVRGAMAGQGSRWRQLPTRDAFIAAVQKFTKGPAAQRRNFEAVALVTGKEKRRDPELRKALSALPPKFFSGLLFNQDSSRSSLGICGR